MIFVVLCLFNQSDITFCEVGRQVRNGNKCYVSLVVDFFTFVPQPQQNANKLRLKGGIH